MEGTQVGFLQNIVGKRVRRTTNGTWEKPEDVEVLQESGIQTTSTYIIRRKVTVSNWVVLHLVFEVCEP